MFAAASLFPYAVLPLDDVLSSQDCAALISAAGPALKRSMVVNRDAPATGVAEVVDKVRTSSQAWIGDDHPVGGAAARRLRGLAASLTGVRSPEMLETVMVARYEPGQKYEAHHDACTKGCAGPQIFRRATLLAYLNDDFQGGTTSFPNIKYTAVPRRGAGILFYSTDPETGEVVGESLHSGDPVLSGSKWIATVWVKFPAALHGM